MHWADRVAKKVVEIRPDRDVYVCAAGISPSGSVHIGNFRDVATAFFVAKGIQKLGKTVRLIFSWDDFDRFRKVPKNVPDSFAQYIGMPYTSVPDPHGEEESYAAYFRREFEDAMREMGVEMVYRSQTQEYKSGRYAEGIISALRRRKTIYDILAKFRTQPPDEEEREAYFPLAIYCSACGKDDTKITSMAEDCESFEYSCKCGHTDCVKVRSADNIKLPWKIDWPMRWNAEEVVFEPGGTDHGTPGGSFDVAKVVSKRIYEYSAPIFERYSFVGLKGHSGKMSSSSGVLLTPGQLLKVYQPEILRWTFAKFAANKEFSIALDEDVIKAYDEFDRTLRNFDNGKVNDDTRRSIEMSLIEGRTVSSVPFRQLAGFSSIFKDNATGLEKFFERLGTPYNESEFGERLQKAEYWLRFYSPESSVDLLEEKDIEYFESLEAEEKKWIRELSHSLPTKIESIDDINTLLYAIPKVGASDEEDKKVRQKRFFTIVYNLLIGKDKGPRLSTFLFALDRQQIAERISF